MVLGRSEKRLTPCLRAPRQTRFAIMPLPPPPAGEPNLGQSRTQLAAAGDLQAGDAVRAQSRLKVLGFTKYRRAAARHSASTPVPEAVPAQPEGSRLFRL